jgi:hypothetical protein
MLIFVKPNWLYLKLWKFEIPDKKAQKPFWRRRQTVPMNKGSRNMRKGVDTEEKVLYTGYMTDIRIRTYAENEERTRRFLDHAKDDWYSGDIKEAAFLATCAVATSNLAIAAAILARPQPDNGVI